MLAFRSLDPFRALREPDRRRRDEERLSRSEQRTLSKTQNNHLTGKAPYKFESAFLQRRVSNEPAEEVSPFGPSPSALAIGSTPRCRHRWDSPRQSGSRWRSGPGLSDSRSDKLEQRAAFGLRASRALLLAS